MSVATLTKASVGSLHAGGPAVRPNHGLGKLASSYWLLISTSAEAILPLLRNIVLVRLLVPQEFGVALTFAVVISMVEVLTDFGLPIYAVRKSETFPRAQMMGTIQVMALIRSASIGASLAAISPLVASLFHAPHSAWAYALLGLVAFLRGFENLGVKEAMRQFVFWREASIVIFSQIVGIAVAIGTAMVDHNFTCLVWGMLAATATTVVGSHLLSTQPYTLRWNKAAARDAAAFGRPLLLNGAAVSISLADRMFVGSLIGAAALAVYNVAYGTATLPRTVLAKFLTSAFLPLFVKHREQNPGDQSLLRAWTVFLSGLAFCYAMTMCIAGDVVLGIVFGLAYKPSRLFMCLAGMSVCVKFLMLLPTPVAYASGQTRIITMGSGLSALSILPAAACLALAQSLVLFMFGIASMEALALMIFGTIFVRKLTFPKATTWSAIAIPYCLLSGLAAVAAAWPSLETGTWIAVCGAAIALSLPFYGTQLQRAVAAARGSA